MPNLFIKARVNDSTVYIKVNSVLIISNGKTIEDGLLDTLHDCGYVVSECTPLEWDLHIEYGSSYEIDTEEEVEEFREINIKAHIINHES